MDSQVQKTDYAIAKPFIEKWHYSKNAPPGKNIYFGWFVDGELYAVANYGTGSNMNGPWKFLEAQTGLPVKKNNLLELKRLCRVGTKNDKQKLPLTKFLSVAHKLLKKDFGIRFIISFSDPAENKFKKILPDKSGVVRPYVSGGIYKAANFQYLGKTNEEIHVMDTEGNIIHRRVAYKKMWRYNLSMCEANGISKEELRAGWKEATNRKKMEVG